MALTPLVVVIHKNWLFKPVFLACCFIVFLVGLFSETLAEQAIKKSSSFIRKHCFSFKVTH